MGNTTSTVRDDAVVRDFLGRRYVAILPEYRSPEESCESATFFRSYLCFLSAAALVLNIIGECTRFVTLTNVPREMAFTMWKVKSETWYGYEGDWTWSPQSFAWVALAGVITNTIAIGYSAALLFTFSSHAKGRQEDKESSEAAQARYGRQGRSIPGNLTATGDVFPYTNLRVMNSGQVENVPYETREAARLRKCWSRWLMAFSMHGAAALCAIITAVSMMNASSTLQMGSEPAQSRQRGASIYFFFATFFIEVICFLFFLLCSPGLSFGSTLVPKRCLLMVVDDADAPVIAADHRHYLFPATLTPLDSVTHGAQGARPEREAAGLEVAASTDARGTCAKAAQSFSSTDESGQEMSPRVAACKVGTTAAPKLVHGSQAADGTQSNQTRKEASRFEK